jgi:hypothetical protein
VTRLPNIMLTQKIAFETEELKARRVANRRTPDGAPRMGLADLRLSWPRRRSGPADEH